MWSPWNLTAFLLEIAIIRPKLQKRKQAHRGDMACPWPHSQKVMELRFKAGEFKGQSHLPSFITISCGPQNQTARTSWGKASAETYGSAGVGPAWVRKASSSQGAHTCK